MPTAQQPLVPGPPSARGPRRRVAARPLLLGVLTVVALLVTVLAVRAVASPDRTSPVSARVRDWPTSGPSSPTTPAAPPAATTSTAASRGGPAFTGDPAPASGGGTGTPDDAFCAAARAGLVDLGAQGAATLASLAVRGGDVAPQARDAVRSALERARALRDTAPAALTGTLDSLVTAWTDLSAALDRAGNSRTELIALSLQYLTTPAVALTWELLARWAGGHCGVDVVDGRPAGG